MRKIMPNDGLLKSRCFRVCLICPQLRTDRLELVYRSFKWWIKFDPIQNTTKVKTLDFPNNYFSYIKTKHN